MMKNVSSTCYHCSSNCQEEIVFDNKVFCCEGCKTVFQILNENEMADYYLLNASPGTKRKKVAEGRFNFLELAEVRSKLILFSNDNIVRVRFHLPQIHCSSCLWLLERLNKLHEGIIQSEVYFNLREAEITFKEDKISLRELAELLSKIGYTPDISLKSLDQPGERKTNKKLVVQIGIVGFCFGNIMLMSFPEYTGIDNTFKDFQIVFNYLNLILSIPVLIFGAKDYILSAYKSLKAKRVNIDVPISLGIFALYFRSLFEVISGSGAGYFDSFAGLIFFLLIGKWFQRKTYDAINFERDYKSYFPIAASKISNGEEQIVPLKNVAVGDQLLIRSQEMIPADAILIKGDARLDYSFVSGESNPVSKNAGDHLYAGGRQIGASIQVEVVKNVENSYLTRLWNNPIFHKKRTVTNVSDVVSKYFTIAVILIALIAGLIWYQIDPSKAPFIVTSVLIVACPCAIALSIPFTHGNLIRQLGRKAFYLRSSDVIEPLNEITDIVFDKTGTLTKTEEFKVKWSGESLNFIEKRIIYSIAQNSSHPLSRGICTFLKLNDTLTLEQFEEVKGKGLLAKYGGEIWKIGSASWLGIDNDAKKTCVFVSRNDQLVGSFEFGNTYRDDIESTIEKLKNAYKIHLLSGDNSSEESVLSDMLGANVNLSFNQSPEDKLNYVQELQQQGKKVLMVGDGLNDAGALKQADVGVAVVDDVYAFSPSSDGIIDGSKLKYFDSYLNFSKYSRKVVWFSYGFSLIYNLTGLYFALTGQLTPLIAAILMPLSSISVLIFVTLLINLRGKSVV